jgi:hypothetical protein
VAKLPGFLSFLCCDGDPATPGRPTSSGRRDTHTASTRPGPVVDLDARYLVRADDGALIDMVNRGFWMAYDDADLQQIRIQFFEVA